VTPIKLQRILKTATTHFQSFQNFSGNSSVAVR